MGAPHRKPVAAPLILLSEPPFANFVSLACAAAALVTFPLGLTPIARLPLVGGVVIAGALAHLRLFHLNAIAPGT